MTLTAVWFHSSSPTGKYRSQLWSTPATGYGFQLRNRLYIIDLLYDCESWLSAEWHATRASEIWAKTSLVDQEDLFHSNWSTFKQYQRTTTIRQLSTYGHHPSEWDYFLLLMYAYQFAVQLTPEDIHHFNCTRELRQLNLDFSPMLSNRFIWRANLIWSPPHRHDFNSNNSSIVNNLTESLLVYQYTDVSKNYVNRSISEPVVGTDDQFTDYLTEELDLDYLRQRLTLVQEKERHTY